MSSDVDSRVIRLKPWQEAVGHLREVTTQDGLIHAFVEHVGVVVLPDDNGLYSELETWRGDRVGILRTDTGYTVAGLEG